eukprot:1658648-Rhodomonas_salina.3
MVVFRTSCVPALLSGLVPEDAASCAKPARCICQRAIRHRAECEARVWLHPDASVSKVERMVGLHKSKRYRSALEIVVSHQVDEIMTSEGQPPR